MLDESISFMKTVTWRMSPAYRPAYIKTLLCSDAMTQLSSEFYFLNGSMQPDTADAPRTSRLSEQSVEKMQDDLWPARERHKSSWFCREGFHNGGCLFHRKRNGWNELGAKSACANRSNAIYISKVKGAEGGRTGELVHAHVGGWINKKRRGCVLRA